MNYRKYKSNPQKLLEEGKRIVTSSETGRYLVRVVAVNTVLSGGEVSAVSEILGASISSISSWVKTVDEKGFEALRSKKNPRRPSKLSPEQMKAIDLTLQSNPNDYGFKVWDGPSLSEYIKNTYDIKLGVRRCQILFHELGFSRIRPQTYPSKGYEETEERKTFKKNRGHQR